MPAKTVQDLIEFNSQSDYKVGVNFETIDTVRLHVSYCFLETGEEVMQRSAEREQYYELPRGSRWDVDQKTRAGLVRHHEPKSDKPLFPWGTATCKANTKKHKYACHDAWIIGVTEAAQGYGPMLYDCLLAKLGESNLGLMSDRSLVSPLAANVWSNYFTSRSDVIKKPLDLDGSTPGTEDDCFADHESDPDWNTWTKDDFPEKEKQQSIRSAIAHAYFDGGIKTLDELRKAGLVYHESDRTLTEYLHQLYKSLLLPA